VHFDVLEGVGRLERRPFTANLLERRHAAELPESPISCKSQSRGCQLCSQKFLVSVCADFVFRNFCPFQDVPSDVTPDSSIEFSQSEKLAEYEASLSRLQQEAVMIKLEIRRNRRKIPRPGCYPLGFSEYSMASAPCTLVLSELRNDLSRCSVVPPNLSVYFEEKMESDSAPPQPKGPKQARPAAQQPTERFSVRRKTPHGQLLCPRSAAEEARQLDEALRKSLTDCNREWAACPRGPSALSPVCSAPDAFEAHAINSFAANILCSLN
jgi:hypothetical protein